MVLPLHEHSLQTAWGPMHLLCSLPVAAWDAWRKRMVPSRQTTPTPPFLARRWTALSAVDGIVRDNCFNNTLDVHKVLASMGFSTAAPLYVTAHWAGADPAASTAVVSGLLGAGYSVVKAGEHAALPREQQALVEFEVAMAAERFIGNSASTFSALAIAQRRHSGKWAAYYNGGDVPLARVVPLFDIPWVFTFNSWSAGYEPMLKAAVNSAARVGGIAPHCIYAGDAAAPVVAWMRAHGVRVIPHEPKWRAVLAELGRAHAAANLRQSHLFASEELIVGTWQRIDLPLVPWLDQYTYVLFTDTDVLFRRPIGFHEFPMPLPRAVGMGPEMVRAGALPHRARGLASKHPAAGPPSAHSPLGMQQTRLLCALQPGQLQIPAARRNPGNPPRSTCSPTMRASCWHTCPACVRRTRTSWPSLCPTPTASLSRASGLATR